MSKKIKRDIKKWDPICITKVKDSTLDGRSNFEKRSVKAVGHNVSGHLMPCCWCFKTNDPDINVLNQEHLKIDNVDSIDEILLSDEWLNFIDSLINDPVKNAPELCWKYCGKGKGYAVKTQEVYK